MSGGLQIFLQPRESFFKRVVIFPVGKVGDEILTQFHGQILAAVGIETGPVAQRVEIRQADGKEFAGLFLALDFARFANLAHHPFALKTVLGKDEEEFVVKLDGAEELLMNFLAALHVLRREPDAHIRLPHPRMKPFGNCEVIRKGQPILPPNHEV